MDISEDMHRLKEIKKEIQQNNERNEQLHQELYTILGIVREKPVQTGRKKLQRQVLSATLESLV